MLNKYINFHDGVIAVIADSDNDKYGLHILINEKRLRQIDEATNDYWRIKVEKGYYYAYIKDGDKITFMHEIITGIHNPEVEERFIEFCSDSTRLVPNPFVGRTDLIEHKDLNGLVNLDENLSINDSLISEFSDINYDKYLEPIFSTLDTDLLHEYSLSTILNTNDYQARLIGLKQYRNVVLSLYEDKLFKRLYPEIKEYYKILQAIENNTLKGEMFLECSKSIAQLYDEYEEIYDEHLSTYYFEGHLIIIYPSVRTVKASKDHICSFTGAIIRKGSYYNSYKLFIEDITDSCIYTTDVFRSEQDTDVPFPTTVRQLDDFLFRIAVSYDIDDELYYDISCNMKTDTLGIKLLKKKR